MNGPGPKNLITDVDGVKVGNAQDATVASGATVILPDERAVAGVDVRGGAPGTRETDALDAACLVDAVDAVVLSGGSSYGLAAASGAAAWLGARGRGFVLADPTIVSPVVPAAILFDLTNGGDKAWGEDPPYDRLGREACQAAGADFGLGNAGAGFGATAGAYKGGLGSASLIVDGLQVGALVAVNSFGSPVMPDEKALWAWPFELNDEFGGQRPSARARASVGFPADTKAGEALATNQNTTIGLVATNATLTSAQARRVAIMAQDGFARALNPIHASGDGDVVFAMSTGRRSLPEPTAASVSLIGTLAADCVARSIGRAVYEAKSLNLTKSYRDQKSV